MNWAYVANTSLIISFLLLISVSVVFKGQQQKKHKWQLICQFIVIIALSFNAGVIFHSNLQLFVVYCFVLLSQILVFISKLKNLTEEDLK